MAPVGAPARHRLRSTVAIGVVRVVRRDLLGGEDLVPISALAKRLSVPIEEYDERFTTVTAERSLRITGTKGKAKRDVIDQVAAAVLLQGWLDALQ